MEELKQAPIEDKSGGIEKALIEKWGIQDDREVMMMTSFFYLLMKEVCLENR
jgi:hypothetical protein